MHNGIVKDKPQEECGVLGIYKGEISEIGQLLYYGLYSLQHRGQQNAGIVVNNGEKVNHCRGVGLVSEIFDEDILRGLVGKIGLGHVRYSSQDDNGIENAQPFFIRVGGSNISLAHNGSLTNSDDLREKLKLEGIKFETSTDGEVILKLISKYMGDGIVSAIKTTMDTIKGAYSLVISTEDKLIAVRDSLAIRPLCLGKIEDGHIIASESSALNTMGASFVRDIEPGEILTIGKEGLRSYDYKLIEKRSSCIFEYIYFARPDSRIDGVSVHEARKNAGKILFEEQPAEADMVIAVPDTSIPAAMGYAEASNIPFGEGLIKNKYIGRTFIEPTQSLREEAVRIKLSPVEGAVRGKRIVVIDDSIVRGTTIRRLVDRLKSVGAKEVHVRISSPPVLYGCCFDIDTPDRDELVAVRNEIEEIRETINADSLGYISLDGLIDSVGLKREDLCLGCFDGKYPREAWITEDQEVDAIGKCDI